MNMKLNERDCELQQLQEIQEAAAKKATITVITGGRRTGRTQLALKATAGRPTLYFYIARKAEAILCNEFSAQAAKLLAPLPFPTELGDFRSLFKALMATSKDKSFNLIIDEFQEFANVNQGIVSDLQSTWSRNRDRSRLCLFLLGTDNAAASRIFEGDHAPLHGLVDHHIKLRPYSIPTLKKVLKKASPAYTPDDLLTFYALTGGIPKYVQAFTAAKAVTPKAAINLICSEDSPFLTEGKQLLIEDFGKEYTIYFSILTCIACGINSRSYIEEYIQKEIGGYLTRLETDFRIIRKQTPLFSKSGSKNVRYAITSNFLRFWFRFLYTNANLIETGQFRLLRKTVLSELREQTTHALHIYHHQKLEESGQFTCIGGWWDHHGDNDIDIIALNEETKQAMLADVRRRRTISDLNNLVRKAAGLHEMLQGYEIEYRILSTDDL